ncbi:MAG: hypothetical protein IJ716_14365 [Lachnospiraceae bacterium]|nr:hypothetical protein [Lachnospiraceae bacterium]
MNNRDVWLAHHGIIGQKWGVRRYQNADGTLTEAGKKRYDRDVTRNHQKSKKNRVDDEDLKDPNRWVEEDLTRSKQILDSSKSLSNELSNLERNTRSKKDNPRMDLSKMTDAELREAINREMLERQYNSIFNAKEVSKGREYVQDTLAVAGSVLGVTSSALGIALAIRQLKG